MDGAAFLAGFTLDAVLLQRIDSAPVLIHQGSYVALLAALLVSEARWPEADAAQGPVRRWSRLLAFRSGLMHFFLGTLLNSFVIFYLRAADWGEPRIYWFVPLLIVPLLLNEWRRFRAWGSYGRWMLWMFCACSYLAYAMPVVLGETAGWMFAAAWLFATVVGGTLFSWSHRASGRAVVKGLWPALLFMALVALAYVSGAMPAVPLSLKEIVLVHEVERSPAGTTLRTRADANGQAALDARALSVRPGDKVSVWARVFAPRRFRDALKVRWLREAADGSWTTTDNIPLVISYAGERGWAGSTHKVNHSPGRWKVRVETDDGRIVGSIRFTVEADAGVDERPFVTWIR